MSVLTPWTYPRVGVAVFVLHPTTEMQTQPRFLLGLRRGSHGAGTWGLPGGHLEHGESFEKCAEREILEETGLRIKDVRFLTTTNDIFPSSDKGRHYVTIFMVAHVALSGEEQRQSQSQELTVTVLEPEKCEAWNWFSWGELMKWIDAEDDGSETNGDRHRPFFPLISLAKQRPGVHPGIFQA